MNIGNINEEPAHPLYRCPRCGEESEEVYVSDHFDVYDLEELVQCPNCDADVFWGELLLLSGIAFPGDDEAVEPDDSCHQMTIWEIQPVVMSSHE